MNIAVIGAGNVGGTLGRRWAEVGHRVVFGVRQPEDPKYGDLARDPDGKASVATVAEAVDASDVVALATPWPATQAAVASAGDLTGKVVVDCTNPIRADFSGLEIGHTSSAGERVASWAPGAHVVKAFNTVGYNIMEDPGFGGEPASMLICGDDADAKAVVSQLAADLGFEPVDAGPLSQAAQLEAMAWLWITMALKYGHGRAMAFRLLHRPTE